MKPQPMGSGSTKESSQKPQGKPDLAQPDSLNPELYTQKALVDEKNEASRKFPSSGNIPGYIDDQSASKNLVADSEDIKRKNKISPVKVKLGKEITDVVSEVVKKNCMDGLTANFENSDLSNSQLNSSNSSSLTRNAKTANPGANYGAYETSKKSSGWRNSQQYSPEQSVEKSPLVSGAANAAPELTSGKDSKALESPSNASNRYPSRRRYSAESLKYFKKNVHTYKGFKPRQDLSEETFKDVLSSESYASKARYSYNPRRKNSYNDALEEDSRVQREKLLRKQIAFAVDETVCGLVIGKGGVNVKKLEKTLGVEIIVNAKKDEKATKRIVTILGSNPVAIQRARDELDFQQVFIPVLGPYQMRLVAKASQDKFQKWRVESGCTRIEFEHSLDDYDPQNFTKPVANGAGFSAPGAAELAYSTRQKIQLKKEEATDNHNGFLRLVGTKDAVRKAQVFIENELDRANKIGMFDPKTKKEEVENTNYNVMNMDSNYSRNAHLKPPHAVPEAQYGSLGIGRMYEPNAPSYQFKKYNVSGPAGMNPSTNTMVYQLWKQQQEIQKIATDNRTNLANLNMNLQPPTYHPNYSNAHSQMGQPAAEHVSYQRRNSLSSMHSGYGQYGQYYGPQQVRQPMEKPQAGYVDKRVEYQNSYNPEPGHQYQYSGQGRGRFRVVTPTHTVNQSIHNPPPEFQKNLDDMLLEGKLSVDEYAIKLAKTDN